MSILTEVDVNRNCKQQKSIQGPIRSAGIISPQKVLDLLSPADALLAT